MSYFASPSLLIKINNSVTTNTGYLPMINYTSAVQLFLLDFKPRQIRITGTRHPCSVYLILYFLALKPSVQLSSRTHTYFFCNFRSRIGFVRMGQDGYMLLCIPSLGLLILELHRQTYNGIRIAQYLFYLVGCKITAMFADRRKDFATYPILERFGLWLV